MYVAEQRKKGIFFEGVAFRRSEALRAEDTSKS